MKKFIAVIAAVLLALVARVRADTFDPPMNFPLLSIDGSDNLGNFYLPTDTPLSSDNIALPALTNGDTYLAVDLQAEDTTGANNGNTADFYQVFEVPGNMTNYQVDFDVDGGGDSFSFPSASFFLSETQISLDDLNLDRYQDSLFGPFTVPSTSTTNDGLFTADFTVPLPKSVLGGAACLLLLAVKRKNTVQA